MDQTTNRATGGDESEVERLRERLAFYESFDRLIQENIARSGELLREAMELRETANRELAEARADAARLRSTGLAAQRALLTELREEASGLHRAAERLAGRVVAALEGLPSEVGDLAAETVERPSRPEREPIPFPAPAPETASAAAPAEPSPARTAATPEGAGAREPAAATAVPFEEEAGGQVASPAAAVLTEPPESGAAGGGLEGVRPFEPSEVGAAAGAVGPASAAPAPAAAQGIVVLVHGVPRAATALSLQRYLTALPHVEGVEPREYAEGVLRLHVTARRPLSVDDLGGWPEGAGFERLNVRDDLLEVRLPGAAR